MNPRFLITGATGQLGQALLPMCPDALGLGRADLDITNAQAVRGVIEGHRPRVIFHCAAWTQVDEAARQPQAAYRVNTLGTQNVALAAARVGATLVYLSTNEVFAGTKCTPYLEYDLPSPPNAYGFSKWAGETIVRQLVPNSYVVRTSWLTGKVGRNFVHRIQALADEKQSLRVVADEIANPTFVADLAPALLALVETEQFGVYHLVNQGHCSRFELAGEILQRTGRGHIPVEPITRAEFNRPSLPPAFSALANVAGAGLGIVLPPWQESLERFLRS